MKNNYVRWGLTGGSLLAIITFLLASFKADDGWLGYWGGILGSAIGVISAVLILKEQIKNDQSSLEAQLDNERQQNKNQQVDNTFFNLLSMHNEQITNLKEKDLFDKINNSFEKRLKEYMEYEGETFLKDNFAIVKSASISIKNAYEEYLLEHEGDLNEGHSKIYEEKWKNRHEHFSFSGYIESKEVDTFCSMGEATEIILKIEKIIGGQIENNFDYTDYFFKNTAQHMKGLEIDIPDEFKKLIYCLDQYYRSDDYICIPRKNRKLAIEQSLNSYYKFIGSYFRLVHRITKYINDNVSDEDIKKNYIGFLRANINQEEMVIIFYNAAYTTRGEGLLHELKKTTFFGTEKDIKRNQHFDKTALFWESDDISIILN